MKQKFETKQEGINYFKDLEYEIKEGPNWFIVIPKQKELDEAYKRYRRHTIEDKICPICQTKFKFGDIRRKICLCKIFIECKFCFKYKEVHYLSNEEIDKIKNNNFLNKIIGEICNNKNNLLAAQKSWKNLWENDPEWRENQIKNSCENVKKAQETVNYLRENNPEWLKWMTEISVKNGKKNVHLMHEKNKELWNDPEWSTRMSKICAENASIARKSLNKLWVEDKDWVDKQRAICAENGKRNIYFANQALQNLRENDSEWLEMMRKISVENIKEAQKAQYDLWKNDPEWRENKRNISLQNLEKANKALDYLWENYPEWAEWRRKISAEIGKENVHFAKEALDYLWENDLEWRESISKIRAKNLEKANEARIEKIKEEISKIPIIISENSINIKNIQELRKNDICGAYVIKAKFKNYTGTERENEVFDLLTCKSKYVYDEIYWILRVLSQPEKQDKVISEANPWTYAKWWYISNLYYDFEFVLLTNPEGVSEEEALLTEAKYAIDNNLLVEFLEDENGNKIPNIEKHSYWNL